MSQQISNKAKSITWLLTLVYFASYFTRINFSVMIVKICNDMSFEKSQLAIVLTGLTIAYGAGQIISGIMGDKIQAQLLLSIGISVAAICNIAMVFCTTIPAMTVVWCINGFAHSMLWPPIVRLMSIYLNDIEYGYGAVRISWGSSFATIILYLLCPLLLGFMSWKHIMVICAAVGIVICVLWTVLNPRLLTDPVAKLPNKEEKNTLVKKIPLPKFVYLPLVLIMIGIVLQGILRDGVTNWMPSYMCEAFGLSEESAIVTAVIPAIFSVISFAVFDLLHRKVFRNEVLCAGVIFGAAAVAAALLYILSTVWTSVMFSTILLALIIAFMHGINLMLITVVPKRFVKSGKISTYSGLLNACTYIGASLSNYGFAILAETYGWSFTILSWIVISVAGLAVCLFTTPIWTKFRREYSDT